MEIKWDIKRGIGIYRAVYDTRLKSWIVTGKIKPGEIVVWRSGFSGWRKPEELDELRPYFKRWEKMQLRKTKKRTLIRQARPSRKEIKNILIIDDETDLTFLLSEVLNRRKYKVSVANTKKGAMAFLKRNQPDLVFLDLKLPDGDGMEILSNIKKANPKTRVNIISAYGSGERKEEAKKKGAYCFIDKPFTDKQIFRCIR